jgi:hypothetical protein
MNRLSRRDIWVGAGSALALAGAASAAAEIAGVGEISRSGAAIHQEIAFAGSAARVYRILTVADEFDKVVRLSVAMNSDLKRQLGSGPTAIDAQPGGAFSLFGGYITGRFLELVPDTRIVQAWRAGDWQAGAYSIARFMLSAEGMGSRLVFDHTGFPSEAADHLASGWHVNYWEPIAKLLS